MNRRLTSLAVALTFATSLAVFAAVTFDPATGQGFVGKGDVQDVFGWNNHALQLNANDVTFSMRRDQTRYKDCLEQGNPHNNPIRLEDARSQTFHIVGALDGDPRQKRGQQQFTGFNLFGFDGQPHNQGQPTQQFCPSGYHPANGDEETGWSDWVTDPDSTVLYATWNGISHQIWP